MSTVAKKMSVTVGTLTTAINNLVKKGYVSRIRSAEDKRVVLLSLTEKGRKVYRRHAAYHKKMVQTVMEGWRRGDGRPRPRPGKDPGILPGGLAVLPGGKRAQVLWSGTIHENLIWKFPGRVPARSLLVCRFPDIPDNISDS